MPRWLRTSLCAAMLALPFAAAIGEDTDKGAETRGADIAGAASGSTVMAAAHPVPSPHPGQAAGFALPRQSYPPTRRESLIETFFGESVADPYRWLEGDVRRDPEVASWVARQNETSRSYLAGLPGRDAIEKQIRSLFDFERFSLPRKAGERYFYTRNSGLQNQSALYVRLGLNGEQRLLLDPNGWSTDGAAALDAWAPSSTGRWVAYAVQTNGSDWRSIGIVDVRTGAVLAHRLEWANDTLIAWVGDEGFLYSRYPAPAAGEEHRAPAFNKSIWYHRVGTPQSEDELVHATPDHPEWGHKALVTSDGRWAVIVSEAGGKSRNLVHLVDLRERSRDGAEWKVRSLVGQADHQWKLVEGRGNRIWFITNRDAPHSRLLRVDLSSDAEKWTEIVRESARTLEGGSIIGERLMLSYTGEGASNAVVTDMSGRPARTITLEQIGAATGFQGRPGDHETFYRFASFNQPPAVFRLDLRSGKVQPFASPRLPFDPADFVVERRFFSSRDGTRVPMYVVRNRALARSNTPAPTILYGYGGFDIALAPSFSAVRMAWLRAGGVFALANVRGGGEFGRAWHDAGRLDRKQNTFDDFIAAGEYLIREGITPAGGLAVQGGSNGGLLVGAVVNQRPDLFAAANPDVGVMDMLRFDRFTAGRFWRDDYGNPEREQDWRVLRGYSPYHNIRKADYPAILVTTADTDDRVVPAHSFKYVAALQGGDTGTRPHLLRVEAGAGHGPGRSTEKTILAGADVLAFLARWTGLKIE